MRPLEIAPLLAEIERLLGMSGERDVGPSIGELESTLTDGYAAALALEAERWRLERRIAELARDARSAESPEPDELSARLTTVDEELGRLRSALRALQERARALRDAAVS